MVVSDDKIQEAFKLLNKRLEGINSNYIKRMAEHIYSIGRLTATDINRLDEMRRMSKNMNEVREEIAKLADISDEELEQIFEKTIDFERYNSGEDNSYVRDVLTSKSIDFENNSSLKRLLEAQVKNTHGDLRNFADTTVLSVPYYKAVDQAILAVRSGVTDYNTAIRSTIRNASSMGLRVREKDNAKVVDYASGYSRRLDSAVRQNVLDGIRDLNQTCSDTLAEQFGMTGVEISAHFLCAEDHLPYQGEQYTNEEFNEIQNSLQRPFGFWNCKHSWEGIYYGESPSAYSSDMLQQMKEYSTEQIEIDGRTKTRYQWSQEQRRLETAMRQMIDIKTAASVKGGDPTLARQADTRYKQYQETYEQIKKVADLKTDYGGRIKISSSTLPLNAMSKTITSNADEEYNAMKRNADIGNWSSVGNTVTKQQIEELNVYANKRCIELHEFDKFDGEVEHIKSFIDRLYTVISDYPMVISKAPVQLEWSLKVNPDDYAITTGHRIKLNANAFRNEALLKADYENRQKENLEEKGRTFFVDGTTYKDIPYHEIAHVLCNYFQTPDAEIVSKVDRDKISDYAVQDVHEGIAESFCGFYSNNTNDQILTIKERFDIIVKNRR